MSLLTLKANKTITHSETGFIWDVHDSETSGIQEFFDLCDSHGCDGHIEGGTELATGGAVVYQVGHPIVISAMQGKKITTGAITINIDGEAIGSSPGITFNSMMMGEIGIYGQIVYHGTGDAVVFRPTTPVP